MALSGLEGLLEVVGLEVMAEGVRAGTHTQRERERERERERDSWRERS